MNVTIIGTGNMAKGIATRLLGGGHVVTVHAKDETKGKALVTELSASGKELSVQPVGTATTDPVVILAIPYSEVTNVATQYDNFAGKVVVDITNPVNFETFQLIPEPGTSGAETIAKLLPEAHVVKAFNTVFAGTLVAGEVDGKQLDVLIAGDDAEAKQTVSEIVNSSDLRAIDVGPLAHARHLEGLALIHMSVQEQLHTGWMSAIKFLG